MATKNWFGINRTVLVLVLAFSLVFLAFSVISAVSYSKVNLAQQDIVIENQERIAELMPNGTLFVGFKAQISNPSGYVIHVTSLNWYSEVRNGSAAIIVSENYTAENAGIIFEKESNRTFMFGWYVTGKVLERLQGFINYSAAHGVDYTLADIPYAHSFEFRGYLDDFQHDYLRENYLNGLVSIDLTYQYGMGGA